MAPSQIVDESLVIELAGKSFKTFCDDISGMFGIDIQCSPQQVTGETIKGLQTHLKDLVALFSFNTEGVLNGNFHLVFDRQGLFILTGIVAMHPEQIILENTNSGSLEQAQKENSILKEVSAALLGSWDRVFRKGLDGHGRFLQTDTFIGNPWDNSEEKIGLAPDEEVTFVPYEMAVGSFPTFKCGIIFTKAFLANTSKPADDQAKPADEETIAANESTSEREPKAAAEQKPDDIEQQPTTTDEAEKQQYRPISDAIQKLTQSSAVSSDESTLSITEEKPFINKDALFAVCAQDIMQKDVIWSNPDDSIQQALSKIQQNDANYVLIGRGQVLEGIVSKTNLTAALSPYLRSIFAKWRRPLDDATLQIRVKWIMVKPASTIQTDTLLPAIMEKMCLTDLRCLPVVDEQSKVQGLVTVFDIFKVLLNQSSHT